MSLLRLAWLGCIFSVLGLVPPQSYRPQVNSLSAPDTLWLPRFLREKAPQLIPYLQAANTYRLQIIYTQVNRDAQNRPILKHYAFRLDTNEYFYPASLIKLPVAILALEKLQRLKSLGITVHTPMRLEKASTGCFAQAPTTAYTLAESIRRQFVYSDNKSFDYLYAFLGPLYATQALWEKGYRSFYLGHRLGRSCSPAENRCAEGVIFLREGKSPYTLPPLCAERDLIHPYAGHPYLLTAQANSLNLKDAHKLLLSVIFPQTLHPKERFQLSNEDYRILRRYLSMYPSEARDPDFDPKEYHDGVRKYFLAGADTARIPSRIRIFNKVGLAYGYLSDVAYIVDFDLGVEFFLSAVLYVGNSAPGYPPAQGYPWATGFRFFKELGWALYRYETTRKRPYLPDLSAFVYDYQRP